MPDRTTKTCDECGSFYFSDSSRMDALCPECAHILYGYQPCEHTFENGRCSKCYWDGTVTDYCKKLKNCMGLSEFQSFVRDNAEWFRGVRPESPASLGQAEHQLGCPLPPSLKWLLTAWGYSGACGISSLTDAVTATLRCRDTVGLPAHYVILNDWGDAGVVYLDTRSGAVMWTDAQGLHLLAGGAQPESVDSFLDYTAWVAARLEVEKSEA